MGRVKELFLLLALSPLMGQSQEFRHATLCRGRSFAEPPQCGERSFIHVISVSSEIMESCSDVATSCADASGSSLSFYETVRVRCEGESACLASTPEAFWSDVTCPPGNWIDVFYRCSPVVLSATELPLEEVPPSSTHDVVTTAELHAGTKPVDVAANRQDPPNEADCSGLLIGFVMSMAWSLLLTTTLLVMCVKRQRQAPTESISGDAENHSNATKNSVRGHYEIPVRMNFNAKAYNGLDIFDKTKTIGMHAQLGRQDTFCYPYEELDNLKPPNYTE